MGFGIGDFLRAFMLLAFCQEAKSVLDTLRREEVDPKQGAGLRLIRGGLPGGVGLVRTVRGTIV